MRTLVSILGALIAAAVIASSAMADLRLGQVRLPNGAVLFEHGTAGSGPALKEGLETMIAGGTPDYVLSQPTRSPGWAFNLRLDANPSDTALDEICDEYVARVLQARSSTTPQGIDRLSLYIMDRDDVDLRECHYEIDSASRITRDGVSPITVVDFDEGTPLALPSNGRDARIVHLFTAARPDLGLDMENCAIVGAYGGRPGVILADAEAALALIAEVDDRIDRAPGEAATFSFADGRGMDSTYRPLNYRVATWFGRDGGVFFVESARLDFRQVFTANQEPTRSIFGLIMTRLLEVDTGVAEGKDLQEAIAPFIAEDGRLLDMRALELIDLIGENVADFFEVPTLSVRWGIPTGGGARASINTFFDRQPDGTWRLRK